jgi:hypothetical protein
MTEVIGGEMDITISYGSRKKKEKNKKKKKEEASTNK